MALSDVFGVSAQWSLLSEKRTFGQSRSTSRIADLLGPGDHAQYGINAPRRAPHLPGNPASSGYFGFQT
jgi:hypothetical protein